METLEVSILLKKLPTRRLIPDFGFFGSVPLPTRAPDFRSPCDFTVNFFLRYAHVDTSVTMADIGTKWNKGLIEIVTGQSIFRTAASITPMLMA